MSAPVFDLLLVSWPPGFPDPGTLDSPFGTFRITRCDTPDGIVAALDRSQMDAVLIGSAAEQAEALADWPALGDVGARTAVVLAAPVDLPAALQLQLVGAGLQDVLAAAEAAAWPRALRLAIERHARERAARRAASTDLLTGLPNQAQLLEHMSQLLALRERAPAPMVVIVLRLEGLASTEASFGREATHALRRKLAVRLRAAVRAGDVIASTAVDRFVVLLPQVQSPDDGAHVADKLLAALRLPIGLAGRQARVGAAAGIAQYPRDGKEAAVLLRVAGDMAALAPARSAEDAPHRNPGPEAANDD